MDTTNNDMINKLYTLSWSFLVNDSTVAGSDKINGIEILHRKNSQCLDPAQFNILNMNQKEDYVHKSSKLVTE